MEIRCRFETSDVSLIVLATFVKTGTTTWDLFKKEHMKQFEDCTATNRGFHQFHLEKDSLCKFEFLVS